MEPEEDTCTSEISSRAVLGGVRLHSLLLPLLLRPPSDHNNYLDEVVELGRDPVLEAVLAVGDALSQPIGAGSPSRSLPQPIAREQAAPSSVPEPVRPGGGGRGGGG